MGDASILDMFGLGDQSSGFQDYPGINYPTMPTAQTKSGQDSLARLLYQTQIQQQQQAIKAQMDQQQAYQQMQQAASLQNQRLSAEQAKADGPYGTLAKQLMGYGNQMVQSDPRFEMGGMLPKAVNELLGSDANPWAKTIAGALAGGFGNSLQNYAYQDDITNQVQPLYKKVFDLSRDPQGGQKMLSDPSLAQFAQPFVLQQLNDEAERRKGQIAAQNKMLGEGMNLQQGADGQFSAANVPGYAQGMAGIQGLEQRAKSDATNSSNLSYDPAIEAMKKQVSLQYDPQIEAAKAAAQGKGLSPALLASLDGTPMQGAQTLDDLKLLQGLAKSQKVDKVTQTNMLNLNQKMQLAAQLNDVINQVDQTAEYAGPLAAMNPNSQTAIYERNIIPLADEIAKAMAGRANGQIIQQNLEAMKPKWGQSHESMKASLGQVRDWVLQHAQDDMKTMQSGGDISQLQALIPQIAMGQGSQGIDPGVAGPQGLPTPMGTPQPTPTPSGPPPGLSFQDFQAWKRANGQ